MKFTIKGIIKGGKNHINITRTGHRYPNPAWAKWRDRVVVDLRFGLASHGNPETINAPCNLSVDYYSGDRRKRDVPAMIDALFHCFEKAGLVKDDCLIENVVWNHKGYTKENPRVEVQIEEL